MQKYSFLLALCHTALSAPLNPTTHKTGAEHIVLLDKNHPNISSISSVLASLSLSESHKDVVHIYNNSAFLGFSARMTNHCLDILSNTTGVTHMEPAVHVASTTTLNKASGAPWGLQRISSAAVDIGGATDELNYTYTYANTLLGSGADVYILDTGVFTKHIVFGGRASMGWSFDGTDGDDDGHGTHVAGIAAGARVGVAQGANIIGVRVLGGDGGGWSSDVVKGVDYALQAHASRRTDSTFTGSILSLSLSSSSPITALNAALSLASTSGIHIVIAAGNDNLDACASSPSDNGGPSGPAIVVGALGPSAQISPFSNTGPCVDVYAPGESVVSAWPPLTTGDDADSNEVKALSGTSMAAPFVTGLVAYAIAGNATLAADPALMKEWVRTVALEGVVQGRDGVVSGDAGLLASNGVVRVTSEQKGDKGGFLGMKGGLN